jgi:hypothetical protein
VRSKKTASFVTPTMKPRLIVLGRLDPLFAEAGQRIGLAFADGSASSPIWPMPGIFSPSKFVGMVSTSWSPMNPGALYASMIFEKMIWPVMLANAPVHRAALAGAFQQS